LVTAKAQLRAARLRALEQAQALPEARELPRRAAQQSAPLRGRAHAERQARAAEARTGNRQCGED